MRHNLSIQFDSILLRPLEVNDALLLRELRNRNARFFFTNNQITEEQQLNWFCSYLTKENEYMFAIAPVEASENFWGAIGIYAIDPDTGNGESGRVIVDREKITRKGVGTLAIRAAAKLAFEQLRIQKLIANILPDNIPSIRAHEKAGYVQIGRDQQSLVYEISNDKLPEGLT